MHSLLLKKIVFQIEILKIAKLFKLSISWYNFIYYYLYIIIYILYIYYYIRYYEGRLPVEYNWANDCLISDAPIFQNNL